jgi:protein-S-isoprenylcysteine O-methyltransferase Ste14
MFPPPLLFLPAIFGGMFLDVRWPLRLPPSRAMDIAAGILIVGFLILVVPSILRFQRSSTSILPFRPASRLVTSGAYRFTRNPMYLGFALLTVGLAFTFETLWPILLLPPTLHAVRKLVIDREERYLARRFGEEYDAYRRRVRRWL